MRKKKIPILAVAFDMDGLIFDTEAVHREAWQTAGRALGYPISDALYQKFIGVTTRECEQMLIETFGHKFPLDDFRSSRNHLREEIVAREGLLFKNGFDELIQFFKRTGVMLALATSSTHEEVIWNFSNTDYLNNFDLIVTGDDVMNGKPNPEIYFMTAKKLNIQPGQLLVLEDSNNGMKAAIAAGAVAVMVPDLEHPEVDVINGAFAIVNDLKSVIDLPFKYDGILE